jgi:homospermidine synthase
VLTHGANPGLVSHFVKQALLNIASDTGVDAGAPKSREDWGQLSRKLGIKVIHIAERDTQLAVEAKGVQRVRQHLVGGRLRQRRPAAGRARLGHAREELSRATASAMTSATARLST